MPVYSYTHIPHTHLFVDFKNQNGSVFRVRGRQAQTILWLYHNEKDGVTSLEMSSWALRLAAYIHALKRNCQIDVETKHELHTGGFHGRYYLKQPVEILKIWDTREIKK